jgi:hypothetical protein
MFVMLGIEPRSLCVELGKPSTSEPYQQALKTSFKTSTFNPSITAATKQNKNLSTVVTKKKNLFKIVNNSHECHCELKISFLF